MSKPGKVSFNHNERTYSAPPGVSRWATCPFCDQILSRFVLGIRQHLRSKGHPSLTHRELRRIERELSTNGVAEVTE